MAAEEIPRINRTMDLSEVEGEWTFDEEHRCWCLEDVLYTLKATTPKFQRLSIFVPASYMEKGGRINPAGVMNGFTAATAPVIFNNNSAGYMQMPHMWLNGPRCHAEQYLSRGFVYVTCGNRGYESKDQDGKRVGKIPANLVDLKTALRFLRHNARVLPGDFEKIVSVGWSAGGAMSSLLALTGNSRDYEPYLKENGAFMDERDDVFAAQIYCPIIDLEHADLAYEWMFAADRENEDSPAGPAGVMTPFEEALSKELKDRYVTYFNGLHLSDPATGEPLLFGPDGRSGSAYEYLMQKLEDSAAKYLTLLDEGLLPEKYSVADYLGGNYTYLAQAPKKEKDETALLSGHAGPGVKLNAPKRDQPLKEPVSLGDLMARPEKGAPEEPEEEQKMTVRTGEDKSSWLSFGDGKARISDLDTYVLSHRRRMKPCTAFDSLPCITSENRVYGSTDQPVTHFGAEIADAIASLKEQFPEEYGKYYVAYALAEEDETLTRQKALNNPLSHIGTGAEEDQAQYYRIRVGAADADTAFSVSMTLALMLADAGRDVDYELVWDQPHSEADYPGELCDWIESVAR